MEDFEVIDNTFWQDFTIADAFGVEAIEDTFNRTFKEWKNDYKMLTALIITLNHKLWYYWEQGQDEFGQLYDKLWKQADHYAVTHLKGEQLKYFYIVTD